MGPLKTILSIALAAYWALPVIAAELDPIVIKVGSLTPAKMVNRR